MRIITLFSLLLAVTLQLAGLRSASAATQAEMVSLQIVHLPGSEGWEARYRLSTAAARLKFLREFSDGRALWQVRTPGLRLVSSEAGEFLESNDGSTFRQAVLRFRSNTIKPPAEYPLNLSFTDGSVLLFPGHLYVRPVRAVATDLRHAIELRPRRGESIVTRGRRTQGPVQWTVSGAELAGTFAYFGKLPVFESEHVISIVDPAFPAVLRSVFETELPRLLRYFTERTGFTLSQRPQLFISYAPDAPMQLSGDVQPGTIAFNFSGTSWSQHPEQLLDSMLHLIAHEVAHLWNGGAFNNSQAEVAPWLHEGGADALAWVALRELDLLSDQNLFGHVSEALNGCVGVNGLGRTSLEQITANRRHELAYPCGSMMYFLVHLALRERGGLPAFWRTLFERARQTGLLYDVESFFATLESLQVDSELSNRLRALWSTRNLDARTSLLQAAARQQLSVVAGKPDPDHVRTLETAVLSRLMAEDCDGYFSFDRAQDGWRIYGKPGCKQLRGETLIQSVAAIGMGNEALYARTFEECTRGGNVEVNGPEGKRALNCPADLPAPLPYLIVQPPAWTRQ